MKITRIPLALLALAAFTIGFAGDVESLPARQAQAGQGAQHAMGLAKAVHQAPAPAATGSWYLPTWEEANAATGDAMACCEAACPMAQAGHAKPAPAEKPVDSWYLPS